MDLKLGIITFKILMMELILQPINSMFGVIMW